MDILKSKVLLSKLWEDSKYLELGEHLCKLIPTSKQPHWFANLLSMVLRDDEKVEAIDSLLKVIREESRWSESREVFDSLRIQTLKCERLDSHNFRKIGTLHLAENIAKVTFNSSNLEQPKFDSDSGYWVPQCIKYIIDHSDDEMLNNAVVEYLISPSLGKQ